MQPKRILIIQTAFLGDVILITPLIRETAALFSDAKIDVMVIPQTAGALLNNPHISEILVFDKRSKKRSAFFSMVRTLRKKAYDLAISPHSSTTSALLMRLGGVRQRLGFDRWHAARYLNLKVPHLKGLHKTEKNLHLLSLFTDKKLDHRTELFPGPETSAYVKDLFQKPAGKAQKVVAIAPGSIWFTKQWPAHYYAELTRELEVAGIQVIFVGGPDEKDLCRQIIAEAGSSARNFAGSATILESAALIEHCDLLICNDSGAMHIANAMNTDVAAFFGPTVRSIGYFPFGENDHVFELDLECRPCGKHGHDACPLDHHNCMRNIQPKEIIDFVTNKLKQEKAE